MAEWYSVCVLTTSEPKIVSPITAQWAYHCCVSQDSEVLDSKLMFEQELSAPCTPFHIDTSTCSHKDLPLNKSAVTSQWLSIDTATGRHHEETPCWSGGSADITQPVYCTHNSILKDKYNLM